MTKSKCHNTHNDMLSALNRMVDSRRTTQRLEIPLDAEPLPSGFRRIPSSLAHYIPEPCLEPEHNPPSQVSMQPGWYEYTCPACGHVVRVGVPAIIITR